MPCEACRVIGEGCPWCHQLYCAHTEGCPYRPQFPIGWFDPKSGKGTVRIESRFTADTGKINVEVPT